VTGLVQPLPAGARGSHTLAASQVDQRQDARHGGAVVVTGRRTPARPTRCPHALIPASGNLLPAVHDDAEDGVGAGGALIHGGGARDAPLLPRHQRRKHLLHAADGLLRAVDVLGHLRTVSRARECQWNGADHMATMREMRACGQAGVRALT